MKASPVRPLAVLLAVLALLGALAPARAQQLCSQECFASVSCDTTCEVCARGATEYPDGTCSAYRTTTCGAAFFPCDDCVPDWRETYRVQRGAFEKDYLFFCELFAVYDVYQTDFNHCEGDRVLCVEDQIGGGFGGCCVGGQCWGQQGC
jgi:hypothetical protein